MKIQSTDNDNFIIRGPARLEGEIDVNGAKNAALSIMIASLMSPGKTTIRNAPRIEELNRFIEIFESIGVEVKRTRKHILRINVPQKLKLSKMNWESAGRTRSVIMMIGALVAREKKFQLPFSGGCHLGQRTVQPHLYALENLGINIKTREDHYEINADKLKGGEVVMYESGDTPTENAIMAAVLASGTTIIKYATANYMVQDLCYFLRKMGAKISGIGSTTLRIEGVSELKPVKYYIINDPIEAMSFISLATTTNSEITINGIPEIFIELELLKLQKMGWQYKIIRRYKNRSGHFNYIDLLTKKSKLKASPIKLEARPYPALNIDNLPVFAPICTQAQGVTLIHDFMYENRAIYLAELQRLGAQVQLLDPHRVQITGPTKLQAAEIMCPSALRAGMVLLIAMFAANGESVLRNVYMINRGYENLPARLRKIGADIAHLKTRRVK